MSMYIWGALILLLFLLSASLYQSQDYLGVCSLAASAFTLSLSLSLYASIRNSCRLVFMGFMAGSAAPKCMPANFYSNLLFLCLDYFGG